MRPSPNKRREAVQKEMDAAMDLFLRNGGEIKSFGSNVYKREGFKLSKKELAQAFVNQRAIDRNIQREKDAKENENQARQDG